MKKLFSSLVLFCTLLFGISGLAQVNANNDTINANGLMGGIVQISGNYYSYYNVLSNDSVDGSYAFSLVTTTLVSTSNPGLSLNNNYVYIDPATPVGTYTMTYQICRILNPTECDTATVTVVICNQAAPTLAATQPDCSSATGSITLSGLPAGNWTIQVRTGWASNLPPISGSGSTYTLSNLSYNTYFFRVVNASGCTSAEVSTQIDLPDGMDVTPVGVYQDANGNGITDAGDIVNWHLDIVNSFPCPLTNVDTVYASIEFTGAPIASIPGNSTDSSVTGVQILTQDDINTGQAEVYVWISADSDAGPQYGKYLGVLPLGINDRIRFEAFIDANGNGLQDAGESNFPYGTFHVQRNSEPVHHIESGSGTHTIYETNASNTYSVSYDMYQSCSSSYSVSPSAYNNLTIPVGSGLTVYPFATTVVPCTDLSVYIGRRETARPGETYSHWIGYGNLGNQPAAGIISFTCDPAVTVVSVSAPGATVTSSGFTLNVGTLNPGDYDYLYVTMQTPPSPTVSLGDLLTSNVSISIPAADSNPANNTDSITEEVTNSYDPNDISESHGPTIVHNTFTSQDYLRYTVRFENTGNADAINIRVASLLDAKLDPATVRMVNSSHPYILDRTGDDLQWFFNGILLPPSVSGTDTGKGFFVFEVKPKPGYAIGDIIPASASIYFDTNPAIVTNTFETLFAQPLGTPQFNPDAFVVFPNPVKSALNISSGDATSIEKVTITDISGKTVLTKTLQTTNAAMDVSSLAKGVYFVKISTGNALKTLKFIKE